MLVSEWDEQSWAWAKGVEWALRSIVSRSMASRSMASRWMDSKSMAQ